MELKNLSLLTLIHNKVGGLIYTNTNIKGRPNVARITIRKRVHMVDLVNRINGNIRNSVRLLQFKSVCSTLNIPYINPILLTLENAWFTGFFDADGTIVFNSKSPFLIIIHVTNKDHSDLQYFIPFFNGK
jgi:ubiquinol-cytochrome c reductase cytochrome b subunit